MAVDTRNRRASCLGFARGGVPVWPHPDGDIATQADRQHAGYSYPGILVLPADIGPVVIRRVTSRIRRDVQFSSRVQQAAVFTSRVKRTARFTSILED